MGIFLFISVTYSNVYEVLILQAKVFWMQPGFL